MRLFGKVKTRLRTKAGPAENEESKIIFVNRFYWPDRSATSQILTDLAEHAAATGRQVLVIASHLLYAERGRVEARRETRNGVSIHRVRTSHFNRHSLIGQLVNYITFYPAAALTLLLRVRRGDIVVVKTDPPMFQLVAWPIVRLRGAKMINWCQDLFPEVARGCGFGWASGPAGAMLQAVRNSVLANSNDNVVVSSAMKAALRSQGLAARKISVIRNWSDAEIQPIAAHDNDLRREWGLEQHFVIGYSGNLGRGAPGESAAFSDPTIRVRADHPLFVHRCRLRDGAPKSLLPGRRT